jgi:hypothetical protein
MTETPIADALIEAHCRTLPSWARREIHSDVASLELALDEACQGNPDAVIGYLGIGRSRVADNQTTVKGTK